MAAPSAPAAPIRFGRFALDLANARLYDGDRVVPVRGKTLAVLAYLAARPGQLVTKDELLRELWPEVHVSEDVLVGCVRELRTMFGDTRGAARFVETVYRRGYRWIAQTDRDQPAADVKSTEVAPGATSVCVGREAQLAELARWYEKAAAGVRQVVFVSGEAGIGKTAFVDAFLRSLPPHDGNAPLAVVVRGQCVEHYGPAEPFLPIVDGLERLSRDPEHAWAADVIAQSLPEAFLSPKAAAAGTATAIMPERAVRLLARAVEALAGEHVIVLVVEDLHWSDASTLDVLSYLSRRADPCRLLVVATYRPTDAILRRHPLRDVEQELRAHQCSVALALGRLTRESLDRWLGLMCPSPPPPFVEWLHRCTDGHPLFVTTLFDALAAAGLVACSDGVWSVRPDYADFGVPESARLMIDRQAEHLDDADRQLLGAASAAGSPFSAASVAAAVERDLVDVEDRCDALAHAGHFLRAVGSAEWPDGTVAGAYEFVHELYRSTFHARLPPAHAHRIHQRIGRRLEGGWGDRADEVASELAVHFERGGDPVRALRYLETVATQCTVRGAHREAVAALRRAIDGVPSLPDAAERDGRLMYLNLRLGASLLVAEDYADPAAEAAFHACRELAERTATLPPLLTALGGLHTCYAARARLRENEAIVPRMIEIAEQVQFPQAKLIAHGCAAWSQWTKGDFATARESAAAAIAAHPDEPIAFPSTFDVVSWMYGVSAFTEMALGNVAEARARAAQMNAWSRRTARPVDRATALALVALLHAFMQEPAAAAAHAAEAVVVAEEHGYRQWLAIGRIAQAWAAAVEQPSPHMVSDLDGRIEEYTRMGLRAMLSAFACLAAGAHLRAGDRATAAQLLDDAERHVRDTGERWYEAEIHRVRGEILQTDDPRAAEASLRQALDVARDQGAKLWELRAAVSLATAWSREKKRARARELLSPILATFPNDIDAADLRAARALRARLA